MTIIGKLNLRLKNFKLLFISALMVLVLIAILCIYTDWNRTVGVWDHCVYAILYVIVLRMTLISPKNWFLKIMEFPILVNIGKIPDGLYLIHVPVIMAVFYIVTHRKPCLNSFADILIIFCSFIVCLITLFITYRFYETPMRNLGRKFKYQKN